VVKAAQHPADLADGLVQRGGVGDVGGERGDRHAVPGKPLGCAGQAPRVAGDDAHRRPLGGQCAGDGKPDAPAPPGDERAGTSQAKIHGPRLPAGWVPWAG
jgi:hypothetical protein